MENCEKRNIFCLEIEIIRGNDRPLFTILFHEIQIGGLESINEDNYQLYIEYNVDRGREPTTPL